MNIKNIFTAIIIILLAAAAIAAENTEGKPVTVSADTASSAEPALSAAKTVTIFDEIGRLFSPAADKTPVPAAVEPEEEDDDEMTMPGKLLLAGDLFSAVMCAVSWINFGQTYDYYMTVYNDANNTTFENYSLLITLRKNVVDNETEAWLYTGLAAAFIAYTAADLIWLHAAFPLEPSVSMSKDRVILNLSMKF